jgi:hypothetical protein
MVPQEFYHPAQSRAHLAMAIISIRRNHNHNYIRSGWIACISLVSGWESYSEVCGNVIAGDSIHITRINARGISFTSLGVFLVARHALLQTGLVVPIVNGHMLGPISQWNFRLG